jgi:cephalosporin hydroxylase
MSAVTATSRAAEIAEKGIAFQAAQKQGEFERMVELVMELQPKVILEIGSMHGGSLLAWRLAAPAAKIISVSLTNGPFGGGSVDRSTVVDGEHVEIVDHLLDMNSHDHSTLTAVMEILGDEFVDFLFIDGDHSYEGVREDFTTYSWLVRAGGLIALHDILSHHPSEGIFVQKFWKRLAARFETQEFVLPNELRDYGVWGGIGVITW